MATSKLFARCSGLLQVSKTPSASFASSASAPASASASNEKGKGLMKVIPVSSQLGKFMGATESSRTEVTKKVWAYIKKNSLQNPANKKEIICDKTLKTIFDGKDTIGMFEIAKLISPHFIKSK